MQQTLICLQKHPLENLHYLERIVLILRQVSVLLFNQDRFYMNKFTSSLSKRQSGISPLIGFLLVAIFACLCLYFFLATDEDCEPTGYSYNCLATWLFRRPRLVRVSTSVAVIVWNRNIVLQTTATTFSKCSICDFVARLLCITY